MINYITYLNLPTKIGIGIVGLVLLVQIIGELVEFTGKTVPECIKIRKYFARRKKEKIEKEDTLRNVQSLLSEVNSHYSTDNITKRNEWMQWVNGRAIVYDSSIQDFTAALDKITEALNNNTKMTEEMFVERCRDRIVDFAAKVSNHTTAVSKEEFNRIFKVYTKYESFLEEHNMTNGEVDIAYRIIQEAYEQYVKHHSFIEDVRGYN